MIFSPFHVLDRDDRDQFFSHTIIYQVEQLIRVSKIHITLSLWNIIVMKNVHHIEKPGTAQNNLSWGNVSHKTELTFVWKWQKLFSGT
jgi:hypothetical protein